MLTSAGTKFVLLTTPSHPSPDLVLRKVYETYADYLKDPFYTTEMPMCGLLTAPELLRGAFEQLTLLPLAVLLPLAYWIFPIVPQIRRSETFDNKLAAVVRG